MNVEMLCIMIMLICTCRYLAVPESDHLTGLDPLNWWSVNATNYPIISVLAKKYLAIPASSASSERVFSTAKNITDIKKMAPASRKTSQDHFFTPQSILLEIALFFQTLYFVVCFIMCVCMYVLSLLHLHCLSWIYIISIVDRGPTDGHGPGLFDLCTVAVRSRSGYLGLTAVHGPLKSSGPRQHCQAGCSALGQLCFAPFHSYYIDYTIYY